MTKNITLKTLMELISYAAFAPKKTKLINPPILKLPESNLVYLSVILEDQLKDIKAHLEKIDQQKKILSEKETPFCLKIIP